MSAIISTCGKYRYWLSREGDPTMQRVAFVMLNPSTADADIDDATIRRCRTFARGAGFVVVNLYAFRATKPADMVAAEDPVGPENMFYLAQVAEGAYKIIAAWGIHAKQPQVRNFVDICEAFGTQIYSIGTNESNGSPRHPLYAPSVTPIEPWVMP